MTIQTATDHQAYIRKVAELALARLDEPTREALQCQITYGAGRPGLRGVTYYGVWQATEGESAGADAKRIPLVEICAFGEQDAVQLAGTTLHELGHVLAGHDAAHGKGWRDACERIGLRRCKAAGNRYSLAQFAPDLRMAIAALPSPDDGRPVGAIRNGGLQPINGIKPAPCPAGIGTRGGKSRGKGSGSRLRLFECQCSPKPYKVRIASDSFDATCNHCGEKFERV